MSNLERAFNRQRPLYVNLLDDLGATDFFVIDGDCLLLDCFSSFVTESHYGCQSVQLCYLVEAFLHSLQNCLNASFCVVFFQQHDRLWQGHHAAYMLLTRQLLQQHLRQRLTVTVHTFDHWSCQEWLQYVTLVSYAIHARLLYYQIHSQYRIMHDAIALFTEVRTCMSSLLQQQLHCDAGPACLFAHDRPVLCIK